MPERTGWAEASSSSDEGAGPSKDIHGLFSVLVFASLLTAVVSTLGAPLVPVLAAEQRVSLATSQWALTITLIVGAVAAPVLGRLADGPHRRRWLVATLAAVALGCVVSAVSPGFAVMLVGRALQGVGYGVFPICLAISRTYTPRPMLTGRIAALSITGATGVGLGYALVAGITELLGYRVSFWFGAVVAGLAIAAVLLVVPGRNKDEQSAKPLDVVGAILLAVGVAGLLLAVSKGQQWGWVSFRCIALLVCAVIVLTIWVVYERRAAHPLVNLRLLRNRSVMLANVSAFVLGVTMFIGFSVITRLAQAPRPSGLGASVLLGGLLLSPLAIGSQASNRLARSMARRVGMTLVLPLGAAIAVLPNVLLAIAHDQAWQMAVAMLLFGAGVGATFAAMPALIIEGVPHSETGSATSFNQLLRSVGGSAGSALSAVILAAYTPQGSTYPQAHGYTVAFIVSTAGCLVVLGALLPAAWPRRGRQPLSGNPIEPTF